MQDQLPGVFPKLLARRSPTPTRRQRPADRSITSASRSRTSKHSPKKLEAQGIKLDRPYTKVPQLGIAIAFIKDPWGTNIEMTEGLADIK